MKNIASCLHWNSLDFLFPAHPLQLAENWFANRWKIISSHAVRVSLLPGNCGEESRSSGYGKCSRMRRGGIDIHCKVRVFMTRLASASCRVMWWQSHPIRSHHIIIIIDSQPWKEHVTGDFEIKWICNIRRDRYPWQFANEHIIILLRYVTVLTSSPSCRARDRIPFQFANFHSIQLAQPYVCRRWQSRVNLATSYLE